MRGNQSSALLLLCAQAISTCARAGDDRVELFQEVTAANTSDLLSLREEALRMQPGNGEWTARSHTFVFPWKLIEDHPLRLASLPLQITFFDGVVCKNVVTTHIEQSGDYWQWVAYCEGTSNGLSMSIGPKDHTLSGSVYLYDEPRDSTIRSIGSNWGIIYQIDPAKAPESFQSRPR